MQKKGYDLFFSFQFGSKYMMENRQKGTFFNILKNKIIVCINIWDQNSDTLKKKLHALMGKEKQPEFFFAKI